EYGDIDEIGIVRDRERVVLRLGQLVKRVVIPDRIEAVLDGRSCAIGRAIGSIQRVSPVARADRNVEEGREASLRDRRDIGWVIEAAWRRPGGRGGGSSVRGGEDGA